jgi:hypothetical protein
VGGGNQMLSKLQIAELQAMAAGLVESRKWDELSWCDAWNGAYPIRPYNSEIETEFSLLQKKVARIEYRHH